MRYFFKKQRMWQTQLFSWHFKCVLQKNHCSTSASAFWNPKSFMTENLCITTHFMLAPAYQFDLMDALPTGALSSIGHLLLVVHLPIQSKSLISAGSILQGRIVTSTMLRPCFSVLLAHVSHNKRPNKTVPREASFLNRTGSWKELFPRDGDSLLQFSSGTPRTVCPG